MRRPAIWNIVVRKMSETSMAKRADPSVPDSSVKLKRVLDPQDLVLDRADGSLAFRFSELRYVMERIGG